MKTFVNFIANHIVYQIEEETKDKSTICNYDDDYYGDRRCKPSKG